MRASAELWRKHFIDRPTTERLGFSMKPTQRVPLLLWGQFKGWSWNYLWISLFTKHKLLHQLSRCTLSARVGMLCPQPTVVPRQIRQVEEPRAQSSHLAWPPVKQKKSLVKMCVGGLINFPVCISFRLGACACSSSATNCWMEDWMILPSLAWPSPNKIGGMTRDLERIKCGNLPAGFCFFFISSERGQLLGRVSGELGINVLTYLRALQNSQGRLICCGYRM